MLNPLLLWFLPLALVPVILHLVTLRRLRTVELSTFRFLMDSYVQQRRRLRLLEWLIMLLRTLFVLLIIFALSRPIIERFDFLSPGDSGRDITLIVDTGPTMALRTGGTTSMQRAKAAARRVLEFAGPNDHVRLISAGSQPETIAQGFAANTDRMRRLIDQLEPGAGRADLGEALRRVADSTARGPRLIYLLSDLSEPTWAGLDRAEALRNLDSDARTVVMDVGANEPITNAAVLGDAPQVTRAVQGLPVLLSATVAHTAGSEPIDTVLSVMLNDERVRQINLSLQPGQRVHKRISVTPNQAGLLRGRFQLAGDAFARDDSYLFSLRVKEAIRVLIVTGPSAETRTDDSELYVRTALRSPLSAERAETSETEQQLARALAVDHLPFNQLKRGPLNDADVVVLADVPMSAQRGRLLREYARAGGGLLVLPGPNVDPKAYGTHLLNHGDHDTGLSLGAAQGDVDAEMQFKPVAATRLAHPVLSAFRDDEKTYFETVRIYRHFPIEVKRAAGEASGDDNGDSDADSDARNQSAAPTVLMRLPDNTPLAAGAALGEGRVLLIGVPATPKWSNLPLKPEFVPIMLRAVAHLQRPAEVRMPSVVSPGQPAPIRLTGRWTNAEVQATDPFGRPHTIELHRDGAHHVGAMLATNQKGYYTVEVLPRAEGAPQQIELGFAVNAEASEGALATVDEQQVRDALAPTTLTFMEAGPDDPMLAAQLTDKHEIWRTLIWITFAVIGAEFLMSTLRPRGEQQARGQSLQGQRGRVGRFIDRLRDTLSPVGSKQT